MSTDADRLRKLVCDAYLTRERRNIYTNTSDRQYFFGKPRSVNPGYSDCSSSVDRCYRDVTGVQIGSYTGAQIVSARMKDLMLHLNGQPAEPNLIKPGDLLYFLGNPSYPYGVGHVEMVIREGTASAGLIAGHGTGTGPTVKNLRDYCASRFKAGKGLIKVRRVIWDSDAPIVTPPPSDRYPLGFGARNLRFGHSGADVRALQRALIELNYSVGHWGADGEFGSATKRAVIGYQFTKGLVQDGIVGPGTRAALERDVPDKGDPIVVLPDDKGTVRIAGGNAWIRTAPIADDAIGHRMTVARNGSAYPWGGHTSPNGWQMVIVDGETGWISGLYARVE